MSILRRDAPTSGIERHPETFAAHINIPSEIILCIEVIEKVCEGRRYLRKRCDSWYVRGVRWISAYAVHAVLPSVRTTQGRHESRLNGTLIKNTEPDKLPTEPRV